MNEKPKKVPVILQMEALECGAASLTMVLAYFKKWLPLEQVREDCGVSRDGSTALNIYRAAERYGMKVRGNRYNIQQLQSEATFPAIIWWNYNHFVVLNGFKGGKAYINDPARGLVRTSMDELKECYSGVCLQFEPGEDFKPGGKPQSIMDFMKKRIAGNASALAIVMVTAALAVAAGVIVPVFSRVFTDEILDSKTGYSLTPFLVLFGLVILFQLISGAFKAMSILRATGKLAATSNAGFMWHTLRLPMGFFAQRMAGDISGRQQSNDQVANTLVKQLAPTVMNFILLIFYLAVMLCYSIPLTIIGVGTISLNMILARIISNKRLEISRTQMRDEGKLNATTVSGIDMIETIKSAGAENGFFERWSGYHASVIRSKVEFSQVNRYLEPLAALIQTLSGVFIISAGVYLIMEGNFTAGMLIAFQSYMTAFLTPVTQVIQTGQSLQEMRASMERIEDVMKYPADVPEKVDPAETEGLEEAEKLSGNVVLEHITFGYSKLAAPLIEDFSLTLTPGCRVALVGGSGSGKSTIAKLLSGLYKPWSGTIKYDGKDISEIPRAVFTGSVSVVDQDVVLFEDTISNNIKLWDSTIEDYEVLMAAKDAGIHDDIVRRKGGYRGMLKEGGRDLSGGQRQRIDIARVLAGDPSIIIMDEATSALDAKTEYEVSESIHERGITCIIVAHRLSTIRDCDEIIVLDNGKVVERGTHDELIKNDGYYRKLVTTE
ncbi:MAG: NHLP family bacteriocin export ABC transporter peptidase/permease/ATPase subunit [Lachnospiraceae bacterium]|nr:NHLP family bacteriocin export ABC transporter peptidase/permease/ATPase subunit [Lachnospiraceae bacterium]